jgi:hypothetical protein
MLYTCTISPQNYAPTPVSIPKMLSCQNLRPISLMHALCLEMLSFLDYSRRVQIVTLHCEVFSIPLLLRVSSVQALSPLESENFTNYQTETCEPIANWSVAFGIVVAVLHADLNIAKNREGKGKGNIQCVLLKITFNGSSSRGSNSENGTCQDFL